MEKIIVKKEELLGVIRNNRKNHIEDYAKAIKAYRVKSADLLAKEIERVEKEYETRIANLKKDLENIISGGEIKTSYAQKPTLYLKEYDMAIKMFEMHIDPVVELPRGEFIQLVNDDWAWQSTFRSNYVSFQGYIGQSGISGCGGTSGSSGKSGTSGSSGISGTSGYASYASYSGTSGTAGTGGNVWALDITFPEYDDEELRMALESIKTTSTKGKNNKGK